MKSELGQSVDHFKRAAALAAQETSATVGPKFHAARDRVQPAVSQARGAATSSWDSALATLTAATENVRQTGKETKKAAKADRKAAQKRADKNAKKLEKSANKALGRKQGRKGKLLGLALVGAAVGAGAAWVVRRRQAAQWDEYDPSAPISTGNQVGGADDAAFEPTPAVTDATVTGVSSAGGASSTGTGSTGTSSTGTGSTGTTSTGTTSTGTTPAGATSTGTTPTETGTTTSAGTVEPIPTGDGDQTQSAMHSPNVARLASGKPKE
jgi:cytoskeletal protein RodZ